MRRFHFTLQSLPRRGAVAIAVSGLWLLAGALLLRANTAPLPPTFSFSPRYVEPGATVVVTGDRFDAAAAAVTLVDVSGAGRMVAAVLLNGPTFTRAFQAPDVPGSYFVVVQDSNGQFGINLIGTLTVLPNDRASFGVGPTTVLPGQTLTVGGSGFPLSAAAVAFGVVDQAGTTTTIGVSALNNGRFRSTFVMPTLAAGAYVPFVIDNEHQLAVNVSGQVTVWGGARPPAIPIGFYPIGAVAHLVTNRIFVPEGGDNTVVVLDGATRRVEARVPVGGLPCAIALNMRTNRAFVANVNTSDVSVIDTDTQSVVATVPVGLAPCALAVTPALNRVFVGNYGDDTVSVLDGTSNTLLTNIAVGRGPFGLAANPVDNRVYVANGYDATVSIIDGASATVLTTVAVGLDPDALAVNPVTNRVYVGNYVGETVSVIDGASATVVATIPVGREPSAVGVNPLTNRVFVTNYASNTVSVIDGATNRVVATIPVGTTPDGVAVDPLRRRVYIVNSNSNSVSILTDFAATP